jgi:predicted kinase
MNIYKNKLIVLRGNSGSGKSTVAKQLREESIRKDNTRKIALVEQDYFRRVVFKEKEVKAGDNIELIRQVTELALGRGYDVILEGILATRRYIEMLSELEAKCPENYFYYFDIPFEETLRRHATKSNADEFGENEMREWWRDKDLIGLEGEQVINDDSSIENTVQKILKDTGL